MVAMHRLCLDTSWNASFNLVSRFYMPLFQVSNEQALLQSKL